MWYGSLGEGGSYFFPCWIQEGLQEGAPSEQSHEDEQEVCWVIGKRWAFLTHGLVWKKAQMWGRSNC